MSDANIAAIETPARPITGKTVVKETLARIAIDYYWLFTGISLSLIVYYTHYCHMNYPLTCETKWPAPIEISFYPMFIIVGGLTKSFLFKRVPGVFSRLRETGALDERAAQQLAEDFTRRLNHPVGTIMGIACGLGVYWFYWLRWPDLGNMRLDLALAWTTLVAIDILLGYAAGVAAWKALVTGWEFRQLGQKRALKIRPFFPDGCAGLGAIGRLFLFLSLILVAVGVYLSGWLLVFYGTSGRSDHGAQVFASVFAGSLIGIVLLSIGAFAVPLLSIHRFMEEDTAVYEAQGHALARRIADLEETLLASGADTDHKELAARLAQIESLRGTYLHQRTIPTWPIDFVTLGKFAGAQGALLISTVMSLLDMWKKIEGVYG
ncbi:hypothetical protein [Microvirga sp. VF16]|uniref:hypothetical protein n=1 Tax=Microvirga sp. VF16 TaxID=2807101 RepID=UPI00193D9DA3|nr:hypothetical protein [Microvirga sp. VF16]QRM33725.1 hypothetical protein JO965_37665 [Microvirga sp. VF16]